MRQIQFLILFDINKSIQWPVQLQNETLSRYPSGYTVILYCISYLAYASLRIKQKNDAFPHRSRVEVFFLLPFLLWIYHLKMRKTGKQDSYAYDFNFHLFIHSFFNSVFHLDSFQSWNHQLFQHWSIIKPAGTEFWALWCSVTSWKHTTRTVKLLFKNWIWNKSKIQTIANPT